jgi:hypothetical protein
MTYKKIFLNFAVLLNVSCTFAMEKRFDNACAADWLFPENIQVPTIYYQGMLESQTQCARYTGRRGFLATTGEHVVSNRSIDVICTPYIGLEIDEVTPERPLKSVFKKWWRLGNIWTCIHYGLNIVRNKRRDIKVLPQGSAQQTIMGHSIDLKKVNIAQLGDVNNHKRKEEKLVAEYGQAYPKILYGVSRGAATTFNAAAMNHYNNVRLVVLEGCFDSLDGLAPVRWPLLYNTGLFSCASWLLEAMTSYQRNGISPIGNVATFPKDVPVLFISSRTDKEVPYVCTQRLAKALVKAGHEQVYFLSLNKSSHVGYMCDDAQDKILYEQVVHALYQKLNLPYIPGLAAQGAELLEQYRMKNSE